MENINFDRLRDLFYGDNPYNVDSLNDLYETARDTCQGNQRKFTKKEVKYYINKQESYQLDLQFNKPKKFDAITSEVSGRPAARLQSSFRILVTWALLARFSEWNCSKPRLMRAFRLVRRV